MALSLVGAIESVGTDFSKIVTERWQDLGAGLLVWLVPHILLQYAVPAVWPGVYDSLGHADVAKGRGLNRAKLAADARNKIICSIQGLYFTVLCIYGLLSEDAGILLADHYASTPLSNHLTTLAASFFVWDLIICILDGVDVAYYFHGVACLSVFLAGVRPFQQYMALVSLLFEASTPLLHARLYLIQTKQADGALFLAVNTLFALVFFIVRIVFGLTASYAWWLRMLELLASGEAHSEAIAYMFMFCNVLLCGLNVFWMYKIVRMGAAVLFPTKAKTV